MNEGGESKGLLPEHVHHIFQVVSSLLDEALMGVERICFIPTLAFEIGDDVGNGEFRFPQGGGEAERENRIDKAVRIADADEALPAKSSHLVGVVWDDVHLLHELYVLDAASEFR